MRSVNDPFIYFLAKAASLFSLYYEHNLSIEYATILQMLGTYFTEDKGMA